MCIRDRYWAPPYINRGPKSSVRATIITKRACSFNPSRPNLTGLWGRESTSDVYQSKTLTPHKGDYREGDPSPPRPRGGSKVTPGSIPRGRPLPAPLDGARLTRRVPGGRAPKHPLRLWAHTRGGNHQSVPGRKVAAKEDRSLDPPAEIRGHALAAGGRSNTFCTPPKKKKTAIRKMMMNLTRLCRPRVSNTPTSDRPAGTTRTTTDRSRGMH